MSIVTQTGDDGTTGLLFNRRVPKDHPRVEAYGSCDELNAAIGLARALLSESKASHPHREWIAKRLLEIQKELVILMGELATLPEDRERYARSGHRFIESSDVEQLTHLAHEIERETLCPDGWATPGATVPAGGIDVARTACRRAERRVFALGSQALALNPHLLKYLNRLSDLLWLMARKLESAKN